jgi:hypothetical protein
MKQRDSGEAMSARHDMDEKLGPEHDATAEIRPGHRGKRERIERKIRQDPEGSGSDSP